MSHRLLNNIDRIRCDFPSAETPERLSWREIQILRLVARGYNNREVSGARNCGRHSEKLHLGNPLENGCQGPNEGRTEGA
jgi:ATP/maltotriose-dependent transcriptional regulator MalT